MYTCTLCRTKNDGDSPALLFVNRYGTPRHLCPSCEALIDTATGDDETKAEEARRSLREVTRGMRDSEAMQVLKNVLDGGTATAEEEEEIEKEYEELRMTEEEEKKAAEEEAIQKKKESSFLSWLPVIGVAVACAAFLVYWFFFRQG